MKKHSASSLADKPARPSGWKAFFQQLFYLPVPDFNNLFDKPSRKQTFKP